MVSRLIRTDFKLAPVGISDPLSPSVVETSSFALPMNRFFSFSCSALMGSTLLFGQQPVPTSDSQALAEPVMTVDGMRFLSWSAYTSSDVFVERGLRCGTPARDERPAMQPRQRGGPIPVMQSDCTSFSTNPAGTYSPTATSNLYNIPVVFHVIQGNGGAGFVSQSRIQQQIDVLNEDFRALSGSPGAPGVDTRIQFFLATVDPNGNPTTGITYSTNNTWYNDNGSYWNSLAWDPDNYLNIYTNQAGGSLGYVPNLPSGGIVGQNSDRVVVLWSTVGRNAPIGPPFNQGRTLTHEVGHYLGLEHTFQGGCGGGNCNSSGDLICDTNAQSSPTNGCPGNPTSCGNQDPWHNYMDYSNDTCMWEFTEFQARRMRCTLENWRVDLADIGTGGGPGCGSFSVDSVSPANVECLIPGTAKTVTISGCGFAVNSTVTVDGVAVTGIPSPISVVDDETIEIDMPQLNSLGPKVLTVTSNGQSASVIVNIVAPSSPRVQVGTGDLNNLNLSFSGLNIRYAGTPNSLHWLLYSTSGAASAAPGVVFLGLGANFSQLGYGPLVVIPAKGWDELNVPIQSAGSILTLYSQSVDLGTSAPIQFPVAASNLQQFAVL